MMDLDADSHAPGAAITAALCGHWDHQPPCPLAPHHTYAHRTGSEVWLRILFATDPDLEMTVRQRIESALSHGKLRHSNGTTQWRLENSTHSEVHADEVDHAQRLIDT